jgi:hypothetical protein
LPITSEGAQARLDLVEEALVEPHRAAASVPAPEPPSSYRGGGVPSIAAAFDLRGLRRDVAALVAGVSGDSPMVMWLRLGGALLTTLVVMAVLDFFGAGSLFGGRSAEEVQHAAQERMRELFWLAIFALVMATSVLAAARRWAGHGRRALVVRRRVREI